MHHNLLVRKLLWYREGEGAAALVAAQETLEVYAFIAAAEESKARGGGVKQHTSLLTLDLLELIFIHQSDQSVCLEICWGPSFPSSALSCLQRK